MNGLLRYTNTLVPVVLAVVFASSAAGTEQQVTASRDFSSDEAINSLTPKIGPVRRAQSLLDKTVTSRDGVVVGTIDDLVLDLELLT